MRANKSTIKLEINRGPCSMADGSDPEAVIGYEENFVRALYGKYKLQIHDPIHYGSWCGRETFLSYQDLILAFKAPSDSKNWV